ncbi:MAG: hypothetical protein V3R99_06870 [Thermoguttaceae bacterium]
MTVQRAINLGGTTSWDRPAALFARWAAGAMVGLLAIVALLMLWRRLASALHTPLDPLSLSAVGLTAVFVAGSARRLWQVSEKGTGPICAKHPSGRSGKLDLSPFPPWVVVLLPSISLLACGAALSLPGTSHVGLAVFWGLVVVEELWTWRSVVRPSTPHKRRSAQPIPQADPTPRTEPMPAAEPTPATEPTPAIEATPSQAGRAVPVESLSQLPGEDVLQHLTRSRTAEGVEQLSGWLRMPFLAGQRTANIHVAFCPPFAKTPGLEWEQCDGPPVRIKAGQVLPHGARLDLKLAQASETPVAVVLEFAARDSNSR